MSDPFRLRVVSHGWLSDDFCLGTHGQISLTIAGERILWHESEPEAPLPFQEDRWEWGVGATAAALLETLFRDHASGPGGEMLVGHGCDELAYPPLTCNVGVDWTVRHEGDDVHLSEVHVMSADWQHMRQPSIWERLTWRISSWRMFMNPSITVTRGRSERRPASFVPSHPHLALTMPWRLYAAEVVAFADVALLPYIQTKKRFQDEYAREIYDEFVNRSARLVEDAKRRLAAGTSGGSGVADGRSE